MGADPRYTTASGYAGGANMADLLQVIYSEDFHGVAMINGGPYNIMHYADVSELDVFVEREFYLNFTTQASHSVGLAKRSFERGLIDDLGNITDIPVLILSETKD